MTRAPRRARAAVAARFAGLLATSVFVAGACSTDGPTSTARGITLPPETVAFPSATAKPRTTPAPPTTVPTTADDAALRTTVAGAEAEAVPAPEGPTTTAAPTTTVVLAICDVNVVISDIGPADEGYVFADLRCGGAWATLVAKAFDQSISTDEVIVLRADGGHWSVEAGGGSTTCSSAGVPPELFGDLGCDRWERRG